jgi:pimeloyl-ACP methyl ester carboxylesterase
VKPKSQHRVEILILVSVSTLASLFSGFTFYAAVYYPASAKAKEELSSTAEVVVKDEGRDYAFLPHKSNGRGAIFYPGGKVECQAYAPFCLALAQSGYQVYLARMPYRFAFFDTNAASRIIAQTPGISSWYLIGHSLGGAFAGIYASENATKLTGLAFLGSYCPKNISQSALKCALVYGSNDGVMNREKYQSCFSNLPSSAVEKVIAGGNHASFGDYGDQRGDGFATISQEEQIRSTIVFLTSVW